MKKLPLAAAAAAALTAGILWRLRPRSAPPPPADVAGDYWVRYLTSEDAAAARDVVELVEIPWCDTHLTADVYTAAPSAPTLIFLPGIALYARPYAGLLLELHRRGFNIVALDLPGTGRSGGPRGGYAVFDYVEAVRAAADLALDRFDTPIFAFGIGLGGILSYYATAADKRLAGVIAYSLLDFTSDRMVRSVVRSGWAFPILQPLVEWGAAYAPRAHLAWDTVLSPRDFFDSVHWYRTVANDPLVLKSYSLYMLQSMVATPPDLPFEWFRRPALVITPQDDDVFPLGMVERAARRLGGETTVWVIPDAAHFSFDRDFLHRVAARVAEWVKLVAAGKDHPAQQPADVVPRLTPDEKDERAAIEGTPISPDSRAE